MANDGQIVKQQVFLKTQKIIVDWLGNVIAIADKKIEALAAKVNVLDESMAALANIVHNLQRSSPQAPPPPPPVRWTEKAVQVEIHFAEERQGRTMMNL
ncbi:hypothetical protein RHSIM_Rhsim08G0145300 [Rhododendron simsii]|uniref:Uncharacterized protein n=1 Tax=Rhododendron simsii TaxID=118357 RepID=A0A834LDQ9_RHOSS|nr:hypothetical protein RHSIM_Rhsim08G0145300 [Rhododendron simsii]